MKHKNRRLKHDDLFINANGHAALVLWTGVAQDHIMEVKFYVIYENLQFIKLRNPPMIDYSTLQLTTSLIDFQYQWIDRNNVIN